MTGIKAVRDGYLLSCPCRYFKTSTNADGQFIIYAVLNIRTMKSGTGMVAHAINNTIKNAKEELGMETDLISDGWHSFGDLYSFRLAYNALAFNLMYDCCSHDENKPDSIFQVHKSWKHNDGEWCFGEEKKWFIVAANLPTGVITNHYKAEHWDLFKIPEVEKSIFPFDGHTAHDALERIFNFLKK